MRARKDAQTATLRHGQVVDLLTQIKAAVAVSKEVDQAQLDELQSGLDVARMTVALLGAELEDADEARDWLAAEVMSLNDRLRELEADNDRLREGNEILTARAEAAESDLVECRLDLAQAENAPSGGTAPATSLDKSNEGVRAVTLTPLAELVRDLAGRGCSDTGIHSIINARQEPKDWLNVAGVRAIREMVVPS